MTTPKVSTGAAPGKRVKDEAKPLPRTTGGNSKTPPLVMSQAAKARKAEDKALCDKYCDDKGDPVPFRETIARAADLDDTDYETERRDMARGSGVRVSVLDQQRDLAMCSEPEVPAAMLEEEAAKLEAECAESAKSIIACEDVLELLMKETRKVIAGEERNVKLLYLACTSRPFPIKQTMNIVIKGPSSAGKSEIRDRLLAFLPPESVITFTSMTEHALIYDSRDYEHKILSMAEAVSIDESNRQNLFLRELISKGRIEHKTPSGTITKDGPVVFLVTTTKDKLHPENETRMLSTTVDADEAQTAAVIDKVMRIEGLNDTDAAIDVKPWQDFQRWLEIGNTEVVVPFSPRLGELMAKDTIRVRRDVSQVLAAIKAHALLHRNHRKLDERGQIIAEMRDYAAIFELLNSILGTKPSGIMQETIEAVGTSKSGVTALHVGKLLGITKSAAGHRLRDAEAEGLVINMQAKRGQPGKYRVVDSAALPTPADLQKTRATVLPKAKKHCKTRG